MHRKYRPRHYADRVQKARALMPDAAIGADVMVGFPGETDAEFEESRQFMAAMPFTYLHVFTYSERPGTPAAEEAVQVPMAVRKERNRVLRELAAAKNLAFRERMVGRTLSAVTLAETGIALTENYLKVELAARTRSERAGRCEDRRRDGRRGARGRAGDIAVRRLLRRGAKAQRKRRRRKKWFSWRIDDLARSVAFCGSIASLRSLRMGSPLPGRGTCGRRRFCPPLR